MHKVLMEQPALRAIRPILWGHILAHYGVKGTLRFYRSGKVYNILQSTFLLSPTDRETHWEESYLQQPYNQS